MSETTERLKAFLDYYHQLSGDEKGEAHVFCDRLFIGFGHAGYKEAGAALEYRLKKGKRTNFADLRWKDRLLIEMKSRGEKLQRHYQKTFEYWIHCVPDRPRYVILCNFDEFWIYDFNRQIDEPVDQLATDDILERYTALNFLFPDEREPQFGNDRVAATQDTAEQVAQVFKSLVARGEDRGHSQRFILQCVVAMFAEDFELLPRGLFTSLVQECRKGRSSYDVLGSLFRQMNSRTAAKGGRYAKVEYFNGGLFKAVEPIDLNSTEIDLLYDAAVKKWNRVSPPIFGSLFQSSMDDTRRHTLGAHFTSEADIQKVVLPTIVRPWRQRIAQATTFKELMAVSDELLAFRVLDPACGSGNFLYVAYREVVKLEMEILATVHDKFKERARRAAGTASLVSTKQFFGLDTDEFAVELAKVTLMLGKRLALAETRDKWFSAHDELPFTFEDPLPLDNLDANIRREDALFCKWPDVDVIIGNPPYQAKNKMQKEFGRAYLNDLRKRYPEMPGMADYCVYWFRRAHDELKSGKRAGLVGTNTVRQNQSRKGGLQYIVDNGGTITEAVSTQVWSGDAAVHVSIVNWVKGDEPGKKALFRQIGDRSDSPWEREELDRICSALSSVDVTQAKDLHINSHPKTAHQGQTPGHDGFVVSFEQAKSMIAKNGKNIDVLFIQQNGDPLLESCPPQPDRMVIDFATTDINEARSYQEPFKHLIRAEVLKARQEAAEQEETENRRARQNNSRARVNHHHRNFLRNWWQMSYRRKDLIDTLATIPRYIACVRVTKRPIFVFVSSRIRPNDSLQVFTFSDDYSFGILQSGVHWAWFTERCSTLTERFRYTSETVYKTFPWPQRVTLSKAKAVASAARELRNLREDIMARFGISLRNLYRGLELPGDNPLKDAQAKLDAAVRGAYGMTATANVLEFLLTLNHTIAQSEALMNEVVGPGLPPCVKGKEEFISRDCVAVRE